MTIVVKDGEIQVSDFSYGYFYTEQHASVSVTHGKRPRKIRNVIE